MNSDAGIGIRRTIGRVVVGILLASGLALPFGTIDAAVASNAMPYVTNLNAALAVAKATGRTVLLFTGRSSLCVSNDPQKHFFDVIFKEHPRLAAQSNRFVVCEIFLRVQAANTDADVSTAELGALAGYAYFLRRYHIRGFHPTVTFLDPMGFKLNGPFAQVLECHPEFSAGSDDCYATLREYAEADPPLRVSEAQDRLRAAVLDLTNPGLELFHTSVDAKAGQKEILLETGLWSRSQVVGKPFRFAVRECGLVRGEFSAAGYDESLVAVTGTLQDAEPFTGPILVRRNGAYFRTQISAVGTDPDHFRGFSSVSLQPGEHYFGIHIRDEKAGQELHQAFDRLRRGP